MRRARHERRRNHRNQDSEVTGLMEPRSRYHAPAL
jgi:hypothetical protein